MEVETPNSLKYPVTITDHYISDRRTGDADAVSRLYRQALNETLIERDRVPRLVGRLALALKPDAYRPARYAPAWRAISLEDLYALECALKAFMQR